MRQAKEEETIEQGWAKRSLYHARAGCEERIKEGKNWREQIEQGTSQLEFDISEDTDCCLCNGAFVAWAMRQRGMGRHDGEDEAL